MYELENADRDTIKKFHSLSAAKEYAAAKWGDDLFFDGDPELGADEIYIFKAGNDDDVIGYISIND